MKSIQSDEKSPTGSGAITTGFELMRDVVGVFATLVERSHLLATTSRALRYPRTCFSFSSVVFCERFIKYASTAR